MNSKETQRARVITAVLAGQATVAQAAVVLGMSERSVYRLLRAMKDAGPESLAHGNRGSSSTRRTEQETIARVVALASTTYRGVNTSHLADLLEEREGIVIGRSTLQRILAERGLTTGKQQRRPKHRSRRERRAQEGMLLQLDASHHDWLEGRGPRLALLAAVDDATSEVVAARFGLVEDSDGYFLLMADVIRTKGRPLALYADKHSIFRPVRQETIDDQLAGKAPLSQFGRAMEELGIGILFAHSPQAKGRVERLWGTLQDRLVSELRLAGVDDCDGANAYLQSYLPGHNRRFAGAPAEEGSVYLPLAKQVDLRSVLCAKYYRTVSRDNLVRCSPSQHKPLNFQILPGPDRRSYAGKRVEVRDYPDGSAEVFYENRRLPARMLTVSELMRPPKSTSKGRTAELAALPPPGGEQLSLAPPAAATATPAQPPKTPRKPAPNHPWNRPVVTKSRSN